MASDSIFADSAEQQLTIAFKASAPACAWTLKSSAAWLSPSSTSGTGGAAIPVKIDANKTGEDRSGSITVAGKSVSITQRSSPSVFADVPPSHYFFDAIGALKLLSIPDECEGSPAKYCPDVNSTRGQMALFVIRAVIGSDDFPYNPAPSFGDVPAGHRYFKWIQKARELGFVEPRRAEEFCPDVPPTRAEVIACVLRARPGGISAPAVTMTPHFEDVPAAHVDFQWVQKAWQLGMTSGCGPRRFCPENLTNRGELAAFTARALLRKDLAPAAPRIASIEPAEFAVGQSVTMTIAGWNTTFAPGITQVSVAGGEVVTSDLLIMSPVMLKVRLTASRTATPGPRSVTVTTRSEEVTGFAHFRVPPTAGDRKALPPLVKRQDAR
jgi:hypothetical protein